MSAIGSMREIAGRWALGIASMAAVSGALAQDAILPLSQGQSQLDNPAAMVAASEDWEVQMQHAARWGNVNTGFNTQALTARKSLRWGDMPGQVGLRFVEDRLGPGLSHRAYGVQASIEQQLGRALIVGAGVQLGLAEWSWDLTGLSWGQQYGPGGFDPSAATGEDAELLRGASRYADWALGVAIDFSGAVNLRGDLALHHGRQNVGLIDTRADSLAFRFHAGSSMEAPLELGSSQVGTLRIWQRSDLQGGEQLLELGAEIRHSFGHNSQYTRHSRSNEIGIGLAYQNTGALRPIFSWRGAGGWSARLGPTLSTGPSGASQGWALALGFAPTYGLLRYPTR